MASTTPTSEITPPTDRSMPPVTITNVIPKATTAVNDAWIRIWTRFPNVAKYGTHRPIRKTATAISTIGPSGRAARRTSNKSITLLFSRPSCSRLWQSPLSQNTILSLGTTRGPPIGTQTLPLLGAVLPGTKTVPPTYRRAGRSLPASISASVQNQLRQRQPRNVRVRVLFRALARRPLRVQP